MTSLSESCNTPSIPSENKRTAIRMIHKCRFTDGSGRGSLRTAHSDVPFSILLPASVDMVSDEHVVEQDCLSEIDIEEALPSDSHTASQTQSNDEKHNFLVSRSGESMSEESKQLPSITRFLPTDHHHNASDTRQEPSRAPLGWKFCTMNVTAFYTQHLAIFAFGCHVCGLQETRLTESGHVWAREVMRERESGASFLDSLLKLCVRLGKRGQEALRLLQDQAWSCRRGALDFI